MRGDDACRSMSRNREDRGMGLDATDLTAPPKRPHPTRRPCRGREPGCRSLRLCRSHGGRSRRHPAAVLASLRRWRRRQHAGDAGRLPHVPPRDRTRGVHSPVGTALLHQARHGGRRRARSRGRGTALGPAARLRAPAAARPVRPRHARRPRHLGRGLPRGSLAAWHGRRQAVRGPARHPPDGALPQHRNLREGRTPRQRREARTHPGGEGIHRCPACGQEGHRAAGAGHRDTRQRHHRALAAVRLFLLTDRRDAPVSRCRPDHHRRHQGARSPHLHEGVDGRWPGGAPSRLQRRHRRIQRRQDRFPHQRRVGGQHLQNHRTPLLHEPDTQSLRPRHGLRRLPQLCTAAPERPWRSEQRGRPRLCRLDAHTQRRLGQGRTRTRLSAHP